MRIQEEYMDYEIEYLKNNYIKLTTSQLSIGLFKLNKIMGRNIDRDRMSVIKKLKRLGLQLPESIKNDRRKISISESKNVWGEIDKQHEARRKYWKSLKDTSCADEYIFKKARRV